MADWMSKLPMAAWDKPLLALAIPGSHHSGSCDLKEESEITADQPWYVRALTSNETIRRGVYNWSKDQSFDITQQLEAGVRYLDVAVVAAGDDFHVAHGLHCMPVIELFRKVDNFAVAHPKEVILIDLNQFHQLNQSQHDKLLKLIDTTFDKKLIPRPTSVQNAITYTLNRIWTDGGQIILFYRSSRQNLQEIGTAETKNSLNVGDLPNYVWTSEFITDPWPRTDDPQTMIKEVEEIINRRDLNSGFQVCQSIVTLTLNAVIRQPLGTFESRYARRATRTLVDWLRKHGYEHRSNINIISTDFVDEENFCDTVIDLNN